MIDYLLQLQGGSSTSSREAAKELRFVPTAMGQIVSPAVARRPRPLEPKLFSDAKIDARLVDSDFAKSYREITDQLIGEVTPSDMSSYFAAAFTEQSVPAEFDRKRVLVWFAARHNQGVAVDRELVEDLPIFPAAGEFHSLPDLVLPDREFRPPLALANVISDQGLSDMEREFLRSLDVPELDMLHFCMGLVPPAVERGLQPSELETLLEFLARHRSQFQDDDEVRRALVDLDLVPCIDGEIRPAEEVYFGDVSPLLVGDRPIAKSAGGAVRKELLVWLGVATEPRASDVIAQCRTISSMPQERRVEVASTVLQHLNELDAEELDTNYAALRTMRWLPVKNETTTRAASEVYQTFVSYLFETQAKFIGVPQQPTQSATAGALKWLGVKIDPPTELIVKHLLACAAADDDVNLQVLVRLNQRSDDPAVESLVGQRCIPVEGHGYVLPTHCFWEHHPFDRHRIRLDPKFLAYQNLLDRIGVRTEPDAADVIDVLGEIAANHGGAAAALLERDIPIVQSCWIFLDELVRRDEVQATQHDELRRTECVLDARNWLRKPTEVLYRDSSQIARKLPAAAAARLIARPDNMKAALDAVGVRHLRDALETTVVDSEDKVGDSEFERLVVERRSLLARVLDEFDDGPYQLLDDFSDIVNFRPLHRLVVVEHLELPGAPYEPAPSDRGALWESARHEFLVVEEEPVWPEIAREFAVALGIEGERAAQVASPLMNVLKAASWSEASEELDMLGYGDIEAPIEIHIEDVTSGLPTDAPDGPTEDPTPPLEPSATETQQPEEDNEDEATPTPGAGEGRAPSPSSPATHESGGGRTSGGATTGSRAPSTGTARNKPRRHTPRQRLVSYVSPVGDGDTARDTDESLEQRSEIDAAAVAAVLEFERSMEREPEEMDHSNPGFDIRSVEPDGSMRYIEVKGTAHAWDPLGVGITSRQYQEATERGEQYWLYVVVVTADGASEPFRIQDPASRIDRYYFDNGWRSAAERSVVSYRELSELRVFDDPTAIDRPVPILDFVSGDDTGTFLPCPPECSDDYGDDLFAVRIAGETMGLLYRGGVAFARRTNHLEDGARGVIRLNDRTDPETGGVLSVRYFGEETSATGEREAAYLETDTGVAPIPVDDLTTIEVVGEVIFRMLPD